MNRDELVNALAAMTDDELNTVLGEARGVDDRDVKALILRELSRPPALNSDAIERQALS